MGGRFDAEAEKWLDMNRTYSAQWPVITRKKDALPTVEEFKSKDNKYQDWFSPNPGEGD